MKKQYQRLRVRVFKTEQSVLSSSLEDNELPSVPVFSEWDFQKDVGDFQ